MPCACQGMEQGTGSCTAGHYPGHGLGMATNGCTVGYSQDTAECAAQHGAEHCPGHGLCTAQCTAGRAAGHNPVHGTEQSPALGTAGHGAGHSLGHSWARPGHGQGGQEGAGCVGSTALAALWAIQCPGRVLPTQLVPSCPPWQRGNPGAPLPVPCDSLFAATAGDKPGLLLFHLGIGSDAQPSAGWEVLTHSSFIVHN